MLTHCPHFHFFLKKYVDFAIFEVYTDLLCKKTNDFCEMVQPQRKPCDFFSRKNARMDGALVIETGKIQFVHNHI